jgi:hypothetical protein
MFTNANDFSLHIETLKVNKGLTYLETILGYCEENYIDPEDVTDLINKSLKEKIAEEHFPKKVSL